jgi:hypothetical protein
VAADFSSAHDLGVQPIANGFVLQRPHVLHISAIPVTLKQAILEELAIRANEEVEEREELEEELAV